MSSKLYYPDKQPDLPPEVKIIPDDSYFLLRLHDSQATLSKTFRWRKAGTILVKSLVQIKPSIQRNILEQPIIGLHRIGDIKYNKAKSLVNRINLTDWLPAYSNDTLKVELEYILIKNEPLKKLLDKMAEIKLSTELTAVKWEVGLGLKITEILGRVFSYLLEEGQAERIFYLQEDLNIGELRPGFRVAAEATSSNTIPTQLIITDREDLELRNEYDHPLEETTYAVLEVLAQKRLSEGYWQETAWGQLLLEGQNEALRFERSSEAKKKKALKEFIEVCYYAGKLAITDTRFIPKHFKEVRAMLVQEIETQFFGQESFASPSTEPLPETWQRAFGYETEVELQGAVEYYYRALADSKAWLKYYGIK